MDDDRADRMRPPTAPHGGARDPAAEMEFTALYRADISNLVRFLMKAFGANYYDAADAAQKAYKHAWQAWDTLSNPSAWTRTVAWRELVKSTSNRDVLTDRPPDFPVLLTPEVSLEISERTEAALRLLATLPKTQRLVLAWFTDGFAIDEIARELDMTQAAVRQNLHRARKALKKRLENMGWGGAA